MVAPLVENSRTVTRGVEAGWTGWSDVPPFGTFSSGSGAEEGWCPACPTEWGNGPHGLRQYLLQKNGLNIKCKEQIYIDLKLIKMYKLDPCIKV